MRCGLRPSGALECSLGVPATCRDAHSKRRIIFEFCCGGEQMRQVAEACAGELADAPFQRWPAASRWRVARGTVEPPIRISRKLNESSQLIFRERFMTHRWTS